MPSRPSLQNKGDLVSAFNVATRLQSHAEHGSLRLSLLRRHAVERILRQSPSGFVSSPSRVFTSWYLMRRMGSIAASPRIAATS